MACVIKRAFADPSQQDQYYNAAPTPTVWTNVIGSATTYATPYLAQNDAKSIRDNVTGFPDAAGSDKIVIWDMTSGAEYPTTSIYYGR